MGAPSLFFAALKERVQTLRTRFSADTARRFLRRSWIRIRSFLRSDRETKTYCLGIAIVLFALIQFVLQKEKTFSVDVVSEFNAKSGQAISGIEPARVNVTIRGNRDAVQSFLDTQNVKIRVSARPGSLKDQKLKLTRWDVVGINDRSLNVVAIKPNRVTVTFDVQTNKSFRVLTPKFENKPLLDNYAVSLSNDVDTVTVRGPKSVLDGISDTIRFRTDLIDLKGKRADFDTTVRILDIPYADNLKWEPTEIPVHVYLSDASVTNAIPDVPLLLAARSGDANPYISNPESVTVWMKGHKDDIASVKREDIYAVVNCANPTNRFEAEGLDLPVRANLRNHPELTVWTVPSVVHVSIRLPEPAPAPEPPPEEPAAPEPLPAE